MTSEYYEKEFEKIFMSAQDGWRVFNGYNVKENTMSLNINDLTLGQIKEIKSMVGGCEIKSSPYSLDNTVQIVILQRGWIVVGRYFKDGENCRIENGYVIRVWGTDRGIGQLAEEGPTRLTKLDKSRTIRFHELTVIAVIDCDESKWVKLCEKL
ncbi:MAG: hypothetical protein KBD78_04075 [Oligoflexales bacterium]|nr:hypothetical protein [Oligoflexales bacterium]